MAVCRVEKTKNYTVMANYHLRDKRLSLKAVGLLSKMLSLPEEWDYTTRGLAAICKDGVDAIGAALKELENCGYLVRHRLRDDRGRMRDTEYVIYTSQSCCSKIHPWEEFRTCPWRKWRAVQYPFDRSITLPSMAFMVKTLSYPSYPYPSLYIRSSTSITP